MNTQDFQREKAIKNSAKGDKIDLGGKEPQIGIFVDKTYQLLIQNNLEWIKIGDSTVGIVDDIQYATKDEVHAYQMKWSVQDSMPKFSYRNFKELLPDFIDSWKVVKEQNPLKKIFLYIITIQQPSKDDTLKLGTQSIGSFSDFLTNYYSKVKSREVISDDWNEFIRKELSELNILAHDFNDFLKNFIFEFDAQRPNYSDDKNKWQIENNYSRYKSFILEELHNPKSKVKFTSKEILKVLNLQTSTTFYHDFFVDYDIYTPNVETIIELNEAIEKHTGGYVLLSGKPGTGKSTLLTEWIKTRNERVVKYYAFSNLYKIQNIPDRGSAKNLFFDLVFQIAETGFYPEKVYPYKDSIEQIQATFVKQLNLLHREYLTKGEKTIIIIDGLDHIPREYKVYDSIIKYLPSTDSIPEGIFIVLGSQTYKFTDIHPSILKLQNDSERSITVKPLSQSVILQIIDKTIPLTIDVKERIYALSEGHPLYLSFILKRIKDSDDIEFVLSQFEQISDINDYYDNIWRDYQYKFELIETLGLIVRLRFGFDSRLLNEWKVSKEVQSQLSYFINQFFDKTFDVWTIFHNSFKQFLLQKTAVNQFDLIFDESIELELNQKLAEYSKSSAVLTFQFDRLYYLFESKQFDEFISIANSDYFDKQLECFRPYYFVFEDLRMGQHIAAERQDLQLLLRFAFFSAEFSRRAWSFNQDTFFDSSSEIIENDILKQYLFLPSDDIKTLKSKMKLAQFYYANGKKTDAKLLYRMAKPVEVNENSIFISENRRFGFREEIKELLKEWVLIVHYFSSITEVINQIKNLKIEREDETPHNDYYVKDSVKLKSELINRLLEFLIETKESEKIKDFINCLDFSIKENLNFYINILEEVVYYFIDEKDENSAQQMLSVLLNLEKDNTFVDAHKIRVAYLVFRVSNDKETILKLIENVELPRLKFEYNIDESKPNEVLLYKMLVLQLTFGKEIKFSEVFSLTKDAETNVGIEFERIFYYLAKLRIESENNTEIDIRRISPIVSYFYQDHDRFRHRTWREIVDRKKDTVLLMINIVSLYDIDSIQKLWKFYLQQFEEYPKYWGSFDFKITILIKLYRIGLDKNEVKIYLQEFGKESVKQESGLDGRIEQSLKLSGYWAELGENDKAKEWLLNSYKESLGVGYRKDYQIQFWMKWIEKINKIEPEKAYLRLEWLNSINSHVERTTENAGTDISEPLLKEILRINLLDGVIQLKWQLEQDLIGYSSSLSLFIETALKNTNQNNFYILFDVWGKLFIYTHRYSDTDLLKKIITRAKAIFAVNQYDNFLNKLRYYLSVNPISEFRELYYEVLIDFGIDFETDLEILKPTLEEKQPKNLKLNDGKELNVDEVNDTINSFEDIWAYFIKQDNSYSNEFDWQPVFEKQKNYLNESNIRKLFDFLKGRSYEREKLFFDLASLSIKKGFTTIGKEITYQILSSSSNTWLHHYDGAKRLEAFRLLIEIDGEKARKEAFTDYSAKTVDNHSSDLFEIEKILEVIYPNYHVKDVWQEMESYLKRLLATADINTNLPKFSQQKKDLDYVIADLLLFYSDQNVLTLSQTAIAIYIKCLSEGNEGFIVRLKTYCLESTYKSQLNSIQILYCTSAANNEVLKNFFDELRVLTKSKLFEVSNKAKDLLYEYTDYEEEYISHFQKESNWKLYRNKLLLQNEKSNDFNIRFKNEEVQIEDILNMSENIVRVLSDILGLGEHVWESKILSICQIIEIQPEFQNYFIKTPQYLEIESRRFILGFIIAKIANNLLLKEIYDLGFIQQEFVEIFDYLTNSIDKDYPKIEIHQRPKFINGIIHEGFKEYGDKSHYHLKDDWYLNVGQNLDNYQYQYNDFVIIAESSFIRCLGNDLECEARNTFISRMNRQIYNPHFPFEQVNHRLIEDYSNLQLTDRDLIILNASNFIQLCPERSSYWVVFNPAIAIQMGWKLCKEGLFRWQDKDGNLMVESKFWIDGNTFTKPPHFKSEAGAGWYVIASNKAFEQLKNKFKLKHHTIFIRKQRNQDNIWSEKSASSTSIIL
ncbi:hypothetical protein GCM10011514_07290 [Emticicia aquatilis]|uniref:Nephrocystin 3-like N-terminal domain-containing protein n=1 Tax=Emticicia aquatilis TaxID=1537369 RepID=A0A916YIJ7_9BACT|nr:ATP-binding protein [Emticicia aquatilis]GGD45829.1 hypothetical protein GCM10011514_07290 [Emticicia aquatilis]